MVSFGSMMTVGSMPGPCTRAPRTLPCFQVGSPGPVTICSHTDLPYKMDLYDSGSSRSISLNVTLFLICRIVLLVFTQRWWRTGQHYSGHARVLRWSLLLLSVMVVMVVAMAVSLCVKPVGCLRLVSTSQVRTVLEDRKRYKEK